MIINIINNIMLFIVKAFAGKRPMQWDAVCKTCHTKLKHVRMCLLKN